MKKYLLFLFVCFFSIPLLAQEPSKKEIKQIEESNDPKALFEIGTKLYSLKVKELESLAKESSSYKKAKDERNNIMNRFILRSARLGYPEAAIFAMWHLPVLWKGYEIDSCEFFLKNNIRLNRYQSDSKYYLAITYYIKSLGYMDIEKSNYNDSNYPNLVDLDSAFRQLSSWINCFPSDSIIKNKSRLYHILRDIEENDHKNKMNINNQDIPTNDLGYKYPDFSILGKRHFFNTIDNSGIIYIPLENGSLLFSEYEFIELFYFAFQNNLKNTQAECLNNLLVGINEKIWKVAELYASGAIKFKKYRDYDENYFNYSSQSISIYHYLAYFARNNIADYSYYLNCAAQEGSKTAYFDIAYMYNYLYTKGDIQYKDSVLKYFTISSMLYDYADAYFLLGLKTFNGEGVEKDVTKGIQLINKAFDLGSINASNLLKNYFKKYLLESNGQEKIPLKTPWDLHISCMYCGKLTLPKLIFYNYDVDMGWKDVDHVIFTENNFKSTYNLQQQSDNSFLPEIYCSQQCKDDIVEKQKKETAENVLKYFSKMHNDEYGKTNANDAIVNSNLGTADAQIGEVKQDGGLAKIYDEKGNYTGYFVGLCASGCELTGYNAKYIVVTNSSIAKIYDAKGNYTGYFVGLCASGCYVKNVSATAILVKDGGFTKYYDFKGNYTGNYTSN